MARTWLPLTVVVLLIAGMTLFLLPEGAGEVGQENRVEDSPFEAPSAADPLVAAPTVEPQRGNAAEVTTRVTISTPQSRVGTVYATPSEEGLLITVLDGNTQKPLPLAEIMVIDSGVADMRLLESEMSISPDFEGSLKTLGSFIEPIATRKFAFLLPSTRTSLLGALLHTSTSHSMSTRTPTTSLST